jgi:hypothetical protein
MVSILLGWGSKEVRRSNCASGNCAVSVSEEMRGSAARGSFVYILSLATLTSSLLP